MKTKYLQAKIDKAIAAALDDVHPREGTDEVFDSEHTNYIANLVSTLVHARGALESQGDVTEEAS